MTRLVLASVLVVTLAFSLAGCEDPDAERMRACATLCGSRVAKYRAPKYGCDGQPMRCECEPVDGGAP